MRSLYTQRCGTCNCPLIYVQRRGSSGGTLVCPVCGVTRRRRSEDMKEKPENRDETAQESYEDAA